MLRVMSLCFVFCLSVLAADDGERTAVPSEVHDNAVPCLVNLTSLPSALVNGCVNVITGDLIEYDQDDIVSGPEAYVLGHSYCSSSLEEGNLGDGWNFLHHHFLEVYQPGRISYVRKDLEGDVPFLYPIEMTDFYRVHVDGQPPLAGPFPVLCADHECHEFCDNAYSCGLSSSSEDLSHPSMSSSTKAEEIGIGAFFRHPLEFLHGLFVEKNYHKSDEELEDPVFLSLFEPSGGRLLFKTDYDEKHKERSMRHFDLVTKGSGFTNLSGGQMSAHTNIKNVSVKWDKKHDIFNVTLGDGTLRVYERQWKQKDMKHKRGHHAAYYRDYQLRKEVKPNGNYTTYQYNKKYEVTEVVSHNKNNQVLNWVKFEQKATKAFTKEPTLHVETSDGHKHVYSFDRLNGSHAHGTYSVSKIQRPGYADTNFEYSHKKSYKKRRVIQKSTSSGSYIKTKYYKGSGEKKDLSVARHKKKSELKLLKDRVGKQFAPVGINGREVVTHRYFYYQSKNDKGGGHCTVRDAYNNITRYFWNKDKRLIKIAKFDSAENALMSEEFIWGKEKSFNEGRLRAQILKDEHGNIRLVHKYTYDGRGNVLEDVLLTRVSENSGEIWFKDDLTHSETCDKIITSYTYSSDGFNLKLSECDPLGNFTYYEYYPQSNLLKAKFICDKREIRKREFFVYDESAIVTEHLVDDGHTSDKDNFEGVTERHMTWITPRRDLPHFGEPEHILEFYIELNTRERKWLKTVQNHYNDRGLIEKQEHIDQVGNRTYYHHVYDDVGRLISTTDPLGAVTATEYDQAGRVVKKSGPRDDVSWKYQYDAAGRLVRETEEHSNGLVLATEYSYDLLNRKTAVKDPYGNTTHYEYDALNRVTKITYPDTYDHYGTKQTPIKTYSYTALGSQVTETDELGLVTKTTYNALGKICDQEFSDGTSRHYYYDLKGNLVKDVAQNGAVVLMSYDGFDRLLESSVMDNDVLLAKNEVHYSAFHPVKEVGPAGETINYSYDLNGRKIAQIQEGRKTNFSYDANGRLLEELTELDNGFVAKTYSYDALDRISCEKLYDHKSQTRSFKGYGYDTEGNTCSVIQNIDDQLVKTEMVFCPHGLPTEQTDAEGNKTLHRYYHDHINDQGQKVLRKETVDARGMTYEEVFDARGSVAQVVLYDPFHVPIAKKELFYDQAGNCIRIHEQAISETGSKTIVTCFEYTNGHLTTLTEAYGTSEEKITRYIYNSFAELETIVHADGVRLRHSYDAKGRLVHFYSSDYTVDYNYFYDASDRILEVINNANGKKTVRSYNSYGELASETLETGLTLAYSYDAAGRVQTLTLPDGSKVAYSYSAYLDAVSRLSPIGEELYSHKISKRDLSGYVQTVDLPAGAGSVGFSRDKLGRTRSILHAQFEQTVPANGFDPTGNLLLIKTTDPEGQITRSFSYDFLSQLTEESGPSAHTYSYDSVYNRLSQDDAAYTVNSLHSVLSDSKKSYRYDPRGNRLRLQSASNDISYTYDALDRLVEVRSSAMHCLYTYDAFNRRLTKELTVGDEYTKQYYLYAQDNEIGAVDESLEITELRILGEGYGAEIAAAVALELRGGLYIPIHDRQGNVALLLDKQGNPVETYRYDAFGNETVYSYAFTNNPWRFSSKRTDQETGLVYFGRRYYDPTIGKWLTQDPLGLKEGPNLYAYVLNCPMTNFDSYGLYVEYEPDRPDRSSKSESSPLVSYRASYGMLGQRGDGEGRSRDSSGGATTKYRPETRPRG